MGPSTDSVPWGNKALPEPMMLKIYDARLARLYHNGYLKYVGYTEAKKHDLCVELKQVPEI